MDFESNYEISRTVDFIRTRNFTKVALQFPDELLEDSTRVAKALRSELGKGVRLYVMADTAYGSCCVDEIGASHVDADCVVHYGHACMSPTSTLPALFIFGKATIDVNACAESLHHCLSTTSKHILVLYGLEYAHALENLKTVVAELLQLGASNSSVHFAEVACSSINPSGDNMTDKKQLYSHNGVSDNEEVHKYENGNTGHISVNCNKLEPCTKYSLGGLIWNMPVGHKMEDYLLFWIGSENPAFTNVVLTFNNCEIVRYDAEESNLLKDFAYQRRILKRRYYLVEKAKDANIVGILVGTLGVAGYLRIIQQMKELIERAGKKSYTLVMGRPNSAKLANFPECDVFVYVSCAQTALLDSKEFLAPVITPFEAILAFSRLQRKHPYAIIQVLWDWTVLDFSVEQHTPPSRHIPSGLESLRGSKWTGEYVINFQDLTASTTSEVVNDTEEARFSFIQGGYIEDIQPLENGEEHKETSLALAEATEKALNLKNQCTDSVLFKGKARSGAEFFAARSFQGLNMQYENPLPQSYVIGRTGKASGYEDEKR